MAFSTIHYYAIGQTLDQKEMNKMVGYAQAPESLENVTKRERTVAPLKSRLNVLPQNFDACIDDDILSEELLEAVQGLKQRLSDAREELDAVTNEAAQLRLATLDTSAFELVNAVDNLKLRKLEAVQSIARVYRDASDVLNKARQEFEAAATKVNEKKQPAIDKAVKALVKAGFKTVPELNGQASGTAVDAARNAAALSTESVQEIQRQINSLKSRAGNCKNLASSIRSEEHLPSVEISRLATDLLKGL